MTTTVSELQRAWRAVQAGVFRDPSSGEAVPDQTARVWLPEPAERVLPVVGAQSGIGATVMALALATVSAPARVVECAGIAVGGLAAAPTAELGEHGSWVRGSRDGVIVERLQAGPIDPCGVAFPPLLDRISNLTVIDVSWDPAVLLSTSAWLASLVRTMASVVVVGTATVPGLRRLENTLLGLDPVRCIVAIVGPPRRRWARCLIPGPATTSLESSGRLLHVPVLPALHLAGADAAELPAPLLAAARDVMAATVISSFGKELS
jgi:hypothetical protein